MFAQSFCFENPGCRCIPASIKYQIIVFTSDGLTGSDIIEKVDILQFWEMMVGSGRVPSLTLFNFEASENDRLVTNQQL